MPSAPSPAEPSAAPSRVTRKPIFTLALITFVDLLGFGLVVLLLPFSAGKFNASPLMIGLMLSTYSACQFIGAPVLGGLSDRIGRRPVLMLSQWGSVAGYLIFALAMWHDWASPGIGLSVLFISRAIDGFSAGNITVANAYIADTLPPKERAGANGLLGAAFGLGFTFGPPIGGILGHVHPAYPGFLAAALSAIASIMVWRYLPESHTDRTRTNAGRFAFAPDRLRALRDQPLLIRLTLIWFLCMLAYPMLEPTIPLLLRDAFGYGQLQAGFFMGGVGIVIALIQGGVVRPLNKRLGEPSLALIGTVMGALGLLIYASQTFGTAVFAIVVLAAICNATGRSLQTPTLSALVSQNCDAATFGAAYGIYQGMASLGRTIGPSLGGALYERHPSAMFLAGAGLICIAGMILLATRSRLQTSLSVENPAAKSPDIVAPAATTEVTNA